MGRRTIAILVFVVGILILAVVVGIFVLGGGDDPPAVTEEGIPEGAVDVGVEAEQQVDATITPTRSPTDTVYVSLQTVPRGFQYPLTEQELIDSQLVRADRRAVGQGGSIRKNFITSIEEIVGKFARNQIFQGETFTSDDLVDDPTLVGLENYSPSSLIPPGSVAAAIPLDELSSVAYALDEGDRIDVMITFFFYQIDEEFQTYLRNAGVFFIQEALEAAEGAETEGGEVEAAIPQDIFVIFPYGRFEELPTGDLAHVSPSEPQRPIPVSMILQNAKVIQVGAWEPVEPVQLATPTPTPAPEGEGDVTPTPTPVATPTPMRPDVLVLALSRQQQLFLKYAVESQAEIDFALRGVGDDQLYTIENIDVDFILQRFGIEVPPNFGFSVDVPAPDATATPQAGEASPEGG